MSPRVMPIGSELNRNCPVSTAGSSFHSFELDESQLRFAAAAASSSCSVAARDDGVVCGCAFAIFVAVVVVGMPSRLPGKRVGVVASDVNCGTGAIPALSVPYLGPSGNNGDSALVVLEVRCFLASAPTGRRSRSAACDARLRETAGVIAERLASGGHERLRASMCGVMGVSGAMRHAPLPMPMGCRRREELRGAEGMPLGEELLRSPTAAAASDEGGRALSASNAGTRPIIDVVGTPPLRVLETTNGVRSATSATAGPPSFPRFGVEWLCCWPLPAPSGRPSATTIGDNTCDRMPTDGC